jgi:hypothetical protein
MVFAYTRRVNILIGVLGVVGLFLVIAATRPAAYRVDRTLEIAAPPEAVFGVLNALRRFACVYVVFGEPLNKVQPTIEGPAGIGQTCAWSGKDAGAGTLTIDESVPGQKVGVKLEFVKPMASKADIALNLTTTAAGTSVTWSMAGRHNFIGKAAGLVMNMDKALGSDIEKGLALLKASAERR